MLFLPFWLHFSPPAHGIGIVSRHDHFSRFLADMGLIYGLPLWMVGTAFVHRLRLPFRYLAWGTLAMMVLLVLLSPSRLAGLALAFTVAAFALFVALRSGPMQGPLRFLWLLIAVGVGLIGLGEFVYVRDAWDGTAYFRFNTVFKTGYQAWFLFAIVGGCALVWNREWLGRRTRRMWFAGVGVLVLSAAVYPVAGAYSRSARFSNEPTVDGLRWLKARAPEDVAAIEWMRARIRGTPTVLEQVGQDFDLEGRGRVSTYTGLPAIIEWGGHEVQWGRHGILRREDDVRRIFATQDPALAERLLRHYGVRYVFVGFLERKDYPAEALAKFRLLGTLVFRSGATSVYRVQG
jgi:uncharacterized membrane protein